MNNFITNSETTVSLKERLQKLISASTELKFLVGFFYFSGWQEIYKTLKENDEIQLKILVGLQVDKYLSGIIEVENEDSTLSQEEHFTHFINSLGYAINNNEMDNEEFYNQAEFFIQLLETNRLTIRKTLKPNHAKLYLFSLDEKYKDLFNTKGQFITGSSNLTKAGLRRQEEFNVEIRDYGFSDAEKYFDELWDTAINITDAKDGKEIITNFLKNKTQAALITPFEAYAYILKTYIDLQTNKRVDSYLERVLQNAGFDKYQYQVDAVNQALNVIEAHNGVIVADVVGLGKSVIASLIAKQLGKRGLILSPPGLIGDKRNNSGWYEYINKFQLHNWDIESTGKIEALAESLREQSQGYEVVIVDEVHKFRNQDTEAYDALANICRGKQVILLTATPFNNSPADIFSLLKLFVVPGRSSITLEENLEARFNSYNYRFKNLSLILKNYNSINADKREKAEKLYIKMFGEKPPINIEKVKKNVSLMARDIKGVITPVTIRRNRLDLREDFEYKKEIQNLSEITDPEELFYELTPNQSKFYDEIISQYFSEGGLFTGAIYRPFEYEEKAKQVKNGREDNKVRLQQRNLFDFMRRLLIKRFESSFGAFDKSIERFLRVHRMVKEFIKISGKYVLDRKVIDSIYIEDDGADSFTLDAIEEALEDFRKNGEGKTTLKHTKIYTVNSFALKDKFLQDIDADISLFESIQKKMQDLDLVNNDPKRKTVLAKVQQVLSGEQNPKRKIILFTEYRDTVLHLKEYFHQKLSGRVLFCDGNITKKFAEDLDADFNAKHKPHQDYYDVLVTSDKLSEGVNLNRAGLIINYDIPWNPTRVIQRIGRINRIGVKVFDELHINNLFPTEQGATHVKIREIAEQKMFLIHNALGEDSKIFNSDEVPTASGLFNKINRNPDEDDALSVETIARNEYKHIVDNYPEVLQRIKELPNRTKTAKIAHENELLVLKRKGMALFALHANAESSMREIDFQEILNKSRCSYEEKRISLSNQFWKWYEELKEYQPRHKTTGTAISIEKQAINSLKSLLKQKRSILEQSFISFIDTLLKDVKQYKTLSKNSLRKLVLPEKKDEPYDELIENIKNLRYQLGDDYLSIVLRKASNINDDVIIAIENIKIP